VEGAKADQSATFAPEPDVLASLLKNIRDQLVALPFPDSNTIANLARQPAPPVVENGLRASSVPPAAAKRIADLIDHARAQIEAVDIATAEAKSVLSGDSDSLEQLARWPPGIEGVPEYVSQACVFVTAILGTAATATCASHATEGERAPVSVAPLSIARAYLEEAGDVLTSDRTLTTEARAIATRLLAEMLAKLNAVSSNAEKLVAARLAMNDAARIVDKSLAKAHVAWRFDHPVGRITNSVETVKITVTNQLTKAQAQMPTTTILWQHTPWELSGGLWISSLKNRTYSVVPVIQNGQASGTVLNKKSSSATAAPAMFVHWRLSESDWRTTRKAFLLTGGIGVRDGTAELVAGVSWARGGLYFGPAIHIGKQKFLTGGLVEQQQNPPDKIDAYVDKESKVRGAFLFSYRLPL
jgi:hypothetical protein